MYVERKDIRVIDISASERQNCLLQRNIPKNQFGTHLDSAKKYLSILKTVE